MAVERGKLVAQLVDRMRDIEHDGARLSDIIALIDSIALQTNLLALNAAVEAAHVGEHGRSLAVVAAEVRQLSRRSADAASEVRTFTARSMDSMRAGAALADRAGRVVASSVQSMQGVSADISRIALTTQSQGA